MKKFEFMLIYDVQDGNPNGDPAEDNHPRLDSETGQGLVSDVCLKRKVRDFIQMVKGGASGVEPEEGYDIWVKQGEPLNTAIGEAAEKALDKANEGVPDKQKLTMEKATLGKVKTGEKTKGGKDKRVSVSKEEWQRIYYFRQLAHKFLCEKFADIRMFGGVVSTGGYNLPVLKGAFQFGLSRSIDPVTITELQMTRCVATDDNKDDASSDDSKVKERTFGNKSFIPYGLYVMKGYFNPNLAEKMGVTEADRKLMLDALSGGMFEFDRSSGRGMMATRKLIVFEHDSPYGSASTSSLFDLVSIKRKDGVEFPRSYTDYEVTIDRDSVPNGVEVVEVV